MNEQEVVRRLVIHQAYAILTLAALIQSRVADLTEDELKLISLLKTASEHALGTQNS